MSRDPRNVMWAEACALLDRAERLHRQFFEPGPGSQGARWEPPTDIFETEQDLCVMVALPGVAPEQVQVRLDGNVLIIAGVRTLPSMPRSSRIHRLEIPYGRFERRILLSGRLELAEREIVNGCLLLCFSKLS